MTEDLTAPSSAPAQPGAEDSRVCVGVVVGAHGIRGQVRIKSFTEEPELLDAYGPLQDEAGNKTFGVSVVGRAKGVIICTVAGVDDRTGAEKLRGIKLYLERDLLPELDEDEFYHSDLVGLTARFADGTVVGRVTALYDFGAGDVMEMHGLEGGVAVIPFTRASVPVIDLKAGEVVVVPLPGALEGPIVPAVSGSRKRSAPKGGARAPFPKNTPPALPEQEEWPDEDWH